MKNHIEIERKFLIRFPDIDKLLSFEDIRCAHITQTYTTLGLRIRSWCEDETTTYIQTKKTALTHLSRIEIEQEIDREEYEHLLSFADKNLSPITKTRYILPYKDKNLEIDVFPFWKKQAFLEIELTDENEEFSIPDFLEIMREVTKEGDYKNFSLAKKIPKEENF